MSEFFLEVWDLNFEDFALNQFYLKKLKTIPNAEYKGQDKVY
jgi:hypothetical protein